MKINNKVARKILFMFFNPPLIYVLIGQGQISFDKVYLYRFFCPVTKVIKFMLVSQNALF